MYAALIYLIKKWKKNKKNNGSKKVWRCYINEVFFDTLKHDLLLAKLNAYGFDVDSLKVLLNCLSSRYQRTKNNRSFSLWNKIIFSGTTRLCSWSPSLWYLHKWVGLYDWINWYTQFCRWEITSCMWF